MLVEKFIQGFSIHALSDFFRNAHTSFKPEEENLDYIFGAHSLSGFSELTRLGNAAFNNTDELIVFTCKYSGQLGARSSRKKQFEIAKKVLKEDFKDGAIFVFYDEDGKFRFSFIRRNWEGKGEKKFSNWRRYTYFIDPNETNKTFKERISHCSFKDLESIQEAFSVEKLTKEFYSDLFKWYQWALSPEVGITFPNNTATSEDDRVKLEEKMIRLITRLLFVWFIKQKHLVPDELFQTDKLSGILKDFDPNSTTDGSYYNAILQNLFFATLNKAVPEREFAKLADKRDIKTRYRYADMFTISEGGVLDLFRHIPFLNGGLFECLDKEESTDGVKYHLDGFSRSSKKFPNGNFKYRAFIPNCVFFDEEKGILPLLKRYNFTVDENSPDEIQVALDPELLGKVFENLLGAFNPETRITARNQSGSFYTPREIVAYMVDESLKVFLRQDFPDMTDELINGLFEEDELPASLVDNQDLCDRLSERLRSIKILDPACGSGAYPMGILTRMTNLLDKLDAKNKNSHYELKLHLIEECIYGVDIQSIAAQISKLRFFVSLIVEQEEPDWSKPEENYGVITLPNLETKFVAANTLIAKKHKAAQGELFENPEIEITKKALLNVRREHFYAKSAGKKRELRKEDAALREKLLRLLQENGEFAPEDALQLSQWNPYDQNTSAGFFDPEWMFGMTKGFDLVIGNPPYVQLQKEGGRLAKMYQSSGYKTFAKTGDIYSLFYERGWQLLKRKGILCYITSNKWMRAGYGGKTRQFFAEETNPVLLIDFAGQKIFETATVDVNILMFKKDKNQQKTKACIIKENVLNNLSDSVRQGSTECTFSREESWTILSPMEQSIKRKIEAIGTPLKDWDINIYRGILTGYNKAFIIDKETRARLIEEDPKSEEIIRPILRGRDIKRYRYDFADLWLINTHNGIKEKGIKPINIDDYPAIKRHLDNFWDKIEKRADQGVTPYNLRNCAYMEDFSKQKIMYSDIAERLSFCLVNDFTYCNNTVYFMVSDTENLEYLLKFLNSNLIDWYYRTLSVQLGEAAVRMFSIYVLNIPIPKSGIENVYDAYNLTTEEINLIESIACN